MTEQNKAGALPKYNRIKGLDFIRGIAILLVLVRHSTLTDNIAYHFGWLGVDLFFVLSGFLVSGLLFREYLKNKSVKIGRFLYRRGLKIYPSFYIFVIVAYYYQWYDAGVYYDTNKLYAELIYLQPYYPNIWPHTWTLGLEEHFYLGLALMVFLTVKIKGLKYVKTIIIFLSSLLLLSLYLRYDISFPHRAAESFGFTKTHLRFDGIIVGVLLSYLHHFTEVTQFILKKSILFLTVAIVLILPGFYFKGGQYFMNTIGLSTVNLGFGLFVIFSTKLDVKNLKRSFKTVEWLLN